MKYSRPRGTHDVTPAEIGRWLAVEGVFQRAFERFGYRGMRTPIFESTDLFVRAVGEQSDIVTKEMYTFTDRGGRSLTLRPENTAAVIRAYLENGMHRWGGIQRLWYAGPMFRYDRPQAGRYREFHQVGAEAIGSASPALDAEIIQLVVEALAELGFAGLDVRLNSVGTEASRVRYRAVLLEAIESLSAELAPEALARYRQNPLRIFDAKEYGDHAQAAVAADLAVPGRRRSRALRTRERTLGLVARVLHRGRPPRARARLLHPHRLRGVSRRARGAECVVRRRTLRHAGRRIRRAGHARHRHERGSRAHRRGPARDQRGE